MSRYPDGQVCVKVGVRNANLWLVFSSLEEQVGFTSTVKVSFFSSF